MKKLLYAIILALSVVLYAGCEEQVFDYDFINMPEGGGSTMVDSDRVIYYTTTDGHKIKTPIGIITLESNVYEKGVGMLRYNRAVASIPDNAFEGFSTLKTIKLPTSVETIGVNAFKDCASLTSVNIPEKVISIGKSAFSGCASLASITIPENVTSIGASAFSDCTSLSSITIPEKVTSIGASAFYNCRGELIINSKIIETDFSNADSSPRKWLNGSKISKVIIGDGVKQIGNMAFYYCTSLTDIAISNSVVLIDEKAFSTCTSLTDVTIGDSVISIGESAFLACSKIVKVNISNLAAWCRIIWGDTNSNPLSKGAGLYLNGKQLTELTIPSEITEVKSYAFYRCVSLTSVIIPDSVTSIGNHAFYGCSGLTSATIGNGVTSIGEYAFYGCSGLTSATISNGVTSIGDSAFRGCSALAEIYCKPTTPPTLGGTAVFDNGPSKRKIYVPSASVEAYKTATNWSEYADQIVADPSSGASTSQYFIEYTSTDGAVVTPYAEDFGANLISNVYENGKGRIYFDGAITKIGENAFRNCSTLSGITIPNGVIECCSNAFNGCSLLSRVDITDLSAWCGIDFGKVYANPLCYGSKLYLNGVESTDLTIPSDVTAIKQYAFYGCTSLVSVTIHDKVISIGGSAFGACVSISRVDITDLSAWCRIDFANGSANPLFNGGKLYLSGTELTDLTIPSDITSINGFTFSGCTSLTSVAIHNQVASIGRSVFSSCTGLTSVTIGNSVTSIDELAFYRCSNLVEIYCKPTTPPALGGTYVFDYGPSSGRQIYVPSASVDAYKTATNWSEYADCIVADSSSSGSQAYKVGDYYNVNGKQGVVFWVDETGKHGKIVSLTESRLQWASDETEQKRLIGADDENNGANNMAVVKQIADWQSKYPAFKWCADLGEGWYLPAINELELFILDQSVHDAVNQTLETKGVKLSNIGDLNYYWSSTEYDGQYMSEFCAWYVSMIDGYTYNYRKSYDAFVRAVSAF